MQKIDLPPVVKVALLASSSGCLIVVFLFVLVGGVATPEYSHASQFISELGARGASFEWSVRYMGFLPAGILLLAFCAIAYASVPRSVPFSLGILGLAIYALGYIVAAFFPCDFGCRPAEPSASQLIHNVIGFAGYYLAPGFLYALTLAAREWIGASKLVTAGYTASSVALIGLLSLTPSSNLVGISQRVLEGSVLGWIALLGIYLARQRDEVQRSLQR